MRDAFFVDRVLRSIAGKPDVDAMHILYEAVVQGEADKAAGYGAPETELNRLRRAYRDVGSRVYAYLDHLPERASA